MLASRVERALVRPWLLVFVVAVAIGLPVLATGELGARDAQDRLHQSTITATSETALRAASAVELRLSLIKDALARANTLPFYLAVSGRDAAAAADLITAQLGQGQTTLGLVQPYTTRNAWVVDAAGQTLATVKGVGKTLPSVNGQPFFDRATRSLTRIGVRPTDVFVTDNVRFEQPFVIESPLAVAPIGDGVTFAGALIVQIRTSTLGDALKAQLGPVEDVVIFDGIGRLVSRASAPDANYTDLSGSSIVQRSLAGNTVQGDAADAFGAGPRVVAVAPVGDSSWRVAAIVGPTAAEADLADSLAQQRAVRLGLIAILLAGSYAFARVLSRSIRRRIALAESLERETATSNALEAASRQLALASQHKSEFLANMSHELRTPLNAIIGFADVLGQKMFGELNPKQSDYVADIGTAGRHLLDLVNQILDLSKVEAGRMELEPVAFAPGETIRASLAFVRERAAAHRIEVAAEIPADLPLVTGDERKIRQVLLNLLSNAVKFTPDGGWIGVTARARNGELEIAVQDTGIGIPPEDQALVFEEFRQVGQPSDRSREGTGLGLTLAKRFVELHGGRIWVASQPGKGSTFTFAIPVERPAPVPAG